VANRHRGKVDIDAKLVIGMSGTQGGYVYSCESGTTTAIHLYSGAARFTGDKHLHVR
jgi:hypothetical protein